MTKKNTSRMHLLSQEELDEKLAAAVTGCPLPHREELEGAVIGAILLDKKGFSSVNNILTADHFYNSKYKIIYAAIESLDKKHIPIDMLTVTEEIIKDKKILDVKLLSKEKEEIENSQRMTIKKRKRLSEINYQLNNYPAAYDIVDCTNRVASAHHIEAHAYILHECFLKREAIINCQKAIQLINDPTHSIVDIRNGLAKSLITTTRDDILVVETATQRQAKGSREPERKQILGSLLREGDIAFMFAEAKTGKTTCSYQMADAISKGEGMFFQEAPDDPFEESESVNKGRYLLPNNAGPLTVLYYDFEMENKELYDRSSLQGAGQEHEFSDNFWFAYDNPKYFDYTDDFFKKRNRFIEKAIEMVQPEVIFIDNVTAMTNEALQDAKVAKRVSGFIKGLKVKHECVKTIVVLAHCPKRYDTEPIQAKHMRGASALGDLTKNLIAIGKSSFDEQLVYIKKIFDRNQVPEFDTTNVISCRINDEGKMLEYEMMELIEEKLLLNTQLTLPEGIVYTDEQLIEEGYMMYLNHHNYPSIVRTMQTKIHWSLSQWRRKIRKYAKEHNASWNGEGEVPREDSSTNYPEDWD